MASGRKIQQHRRPVEKRRPKITICVPSRNRQAYLKLLVVDLLSNPRDDVEFVIADNSDDRTIMPDFMASLPFDPRVRFLPSEDHALGMRDNVERCVEAATGDWVTVCGDDDYIDPNVADLLDRALGRRPALDILSWNRVYYRWPDFRRIPGSVVVRLDAFLGEVPKATLIEDYFGWSHRSLTATVPFTIFHCLVSRKLLERIRRRYGGRFFGHTTVDVDNCCKVLVNGETFMYSSRAFSIDGACGSSHQAKAVGADSYAKLQSEMIAVLGYDPNADSLTATFPFTSTLGIAASGAQAIEHFKHSYGMTFDGWQENFGASCVFDCMTFSTDQADYDRMIAGYRSAFAQWDGGRYARYFDPPLTRRQKPAITPTGVFDNSVVIDENIAGVTRPKEVYDIVDKILAPVDQIAVIEQLTIGAPQRNAA